MLAVAMIAAAATMERRAFGQESRDAESTAEPARVAEQSEPRKTIEEILVTARRREEGLQDAPVAITAFTGETLNRYNVTRLQDVGQMTPQVFMNSIPGGGNGAISIRGIGSSSLGSFEQAVSIYLDGQQSSRGDALTTGYFDLGRVEILKGPQALFFGKNNTAGVLSLESAEPGKEFELVGRSGFEFGAEEYWGEAIASGPVTDNFGARLAVRFNHIEGYVENNAPAAPDAAAGSTAPAPRNRDWPGKDEFLGRLTFVYEPTDELSAKLKVTGSTYDAIGVTQGLEMFKCALGRSQADPGEDCRGDWKIRSNDAPPNIAAAEPTFNKEGGAPYHEYHSFSIVMPVTYDLGPATLTSITGYQDYDVELFGDNDFTALSASYLSQAPSFYSVSQELRLLTTWDSPFNVMVGGYYQKEKYENEFAARSFGLPQDPATGRFADFAGRYSTDGETLSGFVQLIWDATDTLELAWGGRYSRDERDLLQVNDHVSSLPFSQAFFLPQGVEITDDDTFDDFSNEATVTWRPEAAREADVTVYAAYKEGYKSGGFSQVFLVAGTTSDSAAFDVETVRGGEAGIKSTWFGRTLRLNLVGYGYVFDDLQTQFFDALARTSVVQNAGSATTTGMEMDFLWLPPLEGLDLHGSFSYNRARYGDFLSFCYAGQTQALGCNLDRVGNPVAPDAIGARQQLDGESRPVAPEFTAGFGFLYRWPLPFGNGHWLGVSSDTMWVDDYNISELGRPDVVQDGYFRTDATVALSTGDGRMEVAFVGRNLSNEYFFTGAGLEAPFSGAGTGTNEGLFSDQLNQVTRPREVGLQLTLRF